MVLCNNGFAYKLLMLPCVIMQSFFSIIIQFECGLQSMSYIEIIRIKFTCAAFQHFLVYANSLGSFLTSGNVLRAFVD
jgi:hypothetical protein